MTARLSGATLARTSPSTSSRRCVRALSLSAFIDVFSLGRSSSGRVESPVDERRDAAQKTMVILADAIVAQKPTGRLAGRLRGLKADGHEDRFPAVPIEALIRDVSIRSRSNPRRHLGYRR